MGRIRDCHWLRFLLVLLFATMLACPIMAQDDGGDGGDDGDDGDTTIFTGTPVAGVVVDANGVLSVKRQVDLSGALARQRRREAVIQLGRELARPSDLRKVSLNRLEKVVADMMARGEQPGDDVLYLAGLTSLQYVFFYPETKDIVIAGPAEGFMMDALNRPVGISSGDAVLQLEDLIVALRAYGPDGEQAGTIGCSIDPTQDGLSQMQRFLAGLGRIQPSDADRLVEGLRHSLGLQTVTVNGISPNTHFASVLVEADYRMKLIGIGLEEPPVRIRSFVSRAVPSRVAKNALQRWYFVPDYEAVRVSDDGFAVELVGEGVKLVSAYEMVQSDGSRRRTRHVDKASKQFVDSFTRMYPQLARRAPVYAQMRNLIDMLIAAAYIQEQDFYGQAGWSMELFGNEQMLAVEIHQTPQHVDSAVNAVWKGNVLMTPIGGGVHINARRAIAAAQIQPDEDGVIAATREGVDLGQLEDGQWWWD